MKSKLAALTIALTVSTAPAVGAEMTEADEKHYAPVVAQGHLFRPLGWKAPDRTPKWNLLGTKVVGKDALTGTWAYMSRSNSPVRGGAITVIKEGVEFAGSVVTEITNRKVVLENGDIYEQKAVEFLGNEKGRARGSSERTSSRAGRTQDTVRQSGQPERSNRGTAQTSGRNGRRNASSAQRERWQERARQFEGASPEERLRMIEQFRSQRGGRGRSRRGR